MAKRNKAQVNGERRDVSDYYKLNLKAVEDLVTADESNSPQVSPKELRSYTSGPRIRLAEWVKCLLVKIWFAGAVCFFFLWGLGTYLADQLDQMLVVALALGAVTDLLTNNVLRFIAKTPAANDHWMMFPKKGYATFPLNLIYACLLMYCVVMTYNAINVGLNALRGTADTVPLGVGPILFGVISVVWDLIFIQIKRTLKRIVADAKRAAGGR